MSQDPYGDIDYALGVPYEPGYDSDVPAAGNVVPALNLEELARPNEPEDGGWKTSERKKAPGEGAEDAEAMRKNLNTLRRSNQQLREVNHGLKLAAGQSQSVREENEKLQLEVRRLQTQVKSLNGDLGQQYKIRASHSEMKKEREGLKSQVTELEQTLDSQRAQIRTIESIRKQNQNLTRRSTALEEELEDLRRENRELKFDKMVKMQTLEEERQRVLDEAKEAARAAAEAGGSLARLKEDQMRTIADLETTGRQLAADQTSLQRARAENSRLEVQLEGARKSMELVVAKSGELRRNYEAVVTENGGLRREVEDLGRRLRSAHEDLQQLTGVREEKDRLALAKAALEDQATLDVGCLKHSLREDSAVDAGRLSRCSNEVREAVQLLADLRRAAREGMDRMGRIDDLKEFIEEQSKVVDDQSKELAAMREQLIEVGSAHRSARDENSRMRDIMSRMREELESTHSLGGKSEERSRRMAADLTAARERIQKLERMLDEIYETEEINRLFDHRKRAPRRPNEPGPYMTKHHQRRERLVR